MKIIDLLENGHSKRQTMKIVRFVGGDQKKFDELILFCFGKDEKLAQRASWPVKYCIEDHPDFGKKFIRKMIVQLKKDRHNSIHRHFLQALECMEIPVSSHAEIISICFEFLNSKTKPIAVKVFSMSLLAKFCLKYHELWEELKASLDYQMPFESAGFKSRARKILKMYK